MDLRLSGSGKRVTQTNVELLIAHLRLSKMPHSEEIVKLMWEEIQIYRNAMEGIAAYEPD